MGAVAERIVYDNWVRPDLYILGEEEAEKWIIASEAREIKEFLESKLGRGYNVLSEVDILKRKLSWSEEFQRWEVDSATKEYVLENELTAACEAVDGGGYLWSSQRQWDYANEHFLAYGKPFLQMLEAGVEYIQGECRKQGCDKCSFELERRKVEMESEQELTQDYKERKLHSQLFLTISPFPEEEEEEDVREQGYKSNERIGKFRLEVFIKGVRQTVELSVANGSVDLFKRLLETLEIDTVGLSTSLDLLQKKFDLGNSDRYLDTILRIVETYDELLEAEENESSNSQVYFFCGQEVKEEGDKKYSELVERQRWVREKGTEFVRRIYDLDFELVVSLQTGKPTKAAWDSLKYWRKVQDENGEYLLSSEELTEIWKTLASKKMSREAAFILKKNELIRTWSMLACVLNEKRARELFGNEAVEQVQYIIHDGWSLEAEQLLLPFVDQMVTTAQPQYELCGGVVEREKERNKGSLYRMSLVEARGTLFGENNSELFEWICEECGHKHKINVLTGNLKDECENCGVSGRCG